MHRGSRNRPSRPWVTGGCAALAIAALAARSEPSSPQAASAPAAQAVDYARDVRPIFEKFCYECHGPKRARGSLRLHTPELILKGGASGSPITPGKSELSLLIRRVLALDGDDQMPLDRDPLPQPAVAILRAWIDQGASMAGVSATDPAASAPPVEEHWAYVAPVRREPPTVANTAWVKNAIDRFTLARLEREGLSPSQEADRAVLLRRVTLDLTGLPPSLTELNDFLADRSEGAYENVVDRLLASPHYGERWARPWLDLARYADTNGYEKDNRREIWKYRDWVIAALNRDLPFDRFTIEQIAGDMLPNATDDQRIATGFHRNAMTNEEGGVDPEESMYETLVDRVNTTATTWLGSTLACAQCHNHKYDPFSQKDYFRFLAFFANSDYDARTFGDGTRYFEGRLDLATPEQEKARAGLQKEIERLEQTLKTDTPELRRAEASWEDAVQAAERSWTTLVPAEAKASNGVVLRRMPDGSMLASGPNPALTSYTITARTPSSPITGLRLVALPDASLPKGGPGRDAYGHFRLTGIRVQIAPATAAAPRPAARGTALAFAKVKVDDSAYAFTPEDLFEPDEAKRTRSGGAWTINAMRDKERVPRQAVMVPESPFGFAAGTDITIQLDYLDGTIGQGLGRFRIDVTTAPDPLIGAELTPRFRTIVARPRGERSASDVDDLHAFYRSLSPLLAATRDEITAARKKLAALQIASTLVMKERAIFERPSYEVRERGAFTARGARVYAATPKSLHPMRDDLPANRLGLARWLVDEKNPLVARVAVNRLWEQLFGRGLVETSEDFGTQGSPPTHPELLDWLATEFMANGWSQKRLLKTIVISSTYRQSSAVTPQLLERDPYNRLLARGPRFRLEAEMVRDLALAASGLLNLKMFGPSVFPVQPPGIWNQPYSSDKWITSDGDERFRRSLYTFWRRTSPYPSFMTFDATSREYCTVRRVRTNTPLQALTLLNDPASFDAARALARRIVSEPAADATDEERVRFAFTVVLTRRPTQAEVDRLVTLFTNERDHYRNRPEAATALIGAGPGTLDDGRERAAESRRDGHQGIAAGRYSWPTRARIRTPPGPRRCARSRAVISSSRPTSDSAASRSPR
ncbi:MAG TPA: PSD1 and planctomycete cytochrome C domain-containing protein [Vicinamibacterales bacterium]|nr:PSD1 and planctomycete cytochrome C domain-containing protein [Vicinamibacterales bacterium]